MIERYYTFAVEKFYSDYELNKKLFEELKIKRADALVGGGLDYSSDKVSGGKIGNPTEQRAFKRYDLEYKIRELQEYFDCFDKIFSKLTKEQQMVVKYYFMAIDKTGGRYRIQETLHIERASFYRLKDETVKVIQQIAEWT